ncbi:SDR family oxidoreductase [Novosphingobium pentaromativorans]|uniref:NAD-dependent epimerase/dehydratase domain-containing protein n=1 Tax=Novosphingobium pentaromativorans US6-1 TaxID=1088721 RepID=G6ED84_9SPHN|nr:SDR family oxidoreductase [Novosphingobium pentaromativorans]AIT79823.1 short-chain dehydrogenase [Novosphingobium pentaromativorans US6-1]EHJ60683.1 hypothetical protein NSU_2305 [Novosphingobium pentaromativorans US6-1]
MSAGTKRVLIAGATGLVGDAAVRAFVDSGWDVIAVSRRPLDEDLEGRVRHVCVDLTDRDACRVAFGELHGVTHVVYAALYEKPGLIAGWREQDQMDTNLAMLANLFDPLSSANPIAHMTLLQGTKAYGAHTGPRVLLPAREDMPRDPHENFYWLHEDYIREKAGHDGFSWTIFRPQIVMGAVWGAAMNPLIPIQAYAAIRRELGQGFAFPGGVPMVSEMADPRLLGAAFVWAADAPEAAFETFNITNGDVFSWATMWPVLAEVYGMETGPDEACRLAEFLPAHREVWDRIVARHGLRPIALERLLGQSHHYVDRLLRAGNETVTLPVLVSTIKLRQAGFGACYDSRDTLRHWTRELARRKVMPPLPA